VTWHSGEAAVFLGFPMGQTDKKMWEMTVKVLQKVPRGASHPGHEGCAIVITVCGLVLDDFAHAAISMVLSR